MNIETILNFLLVAACVGLSCLSITFSWTFFREKEYRAAIISAAGVAIFLGFLIVIVRWNVPVKYNIIFLSLCVFAALVMLLPLGRKKGLKEVAVPHALDEREIMFARALYLPGSPEYSDYYSRNPGNKTKDDQIRALPLLCKPGSELYHELNSPLADSWFFMLEKWRDFVDGEVAEKQVRLSPSDATRRLKGLARYFSADDVGVARLRPHHIYTHVGRGTGKYGDPITLTHEYALVFTIPMTYNMMRNAPGVGVITESARWYTEAAKIACAIAEYIRALGYSARAHMDGNYRIILPAVAVDAGLGEIGRLDLLITKKHGPRVRLGAVTTDLPLIPDKPIVFGVQDFCERCKKCADNCPSNAIPRGSKRIVRGVEKWATNQEECYQHWRKIGTDCGLCISVCPYSKPDTFAHKIIRVAAEQSFVSRQIATWSDDIFFGKHPRPMQLPEWMR